MPGKRRFAIGYNAECPIEIIDPCEHQNRKFPGDWDTLRETTDLVASIRKNGVLQPVVGRPSPSKPDHIQLLCGERRLRASKLAECATIPILVREMSDEDAVTVT